MNENSNDLFQKATKVIPGGVNSPVRAFNAVKSNPVFIKEAYDAYIISEDNQQYIDYVGSWGPMILGHNNQKTLEAVTTAAAKGLSYGAPCKYEVEIAEYICNLIPSIDMIRMVNSGTEATLSALRVARAFSEKDKIIKFDGCYHGHSDSLLVKAGSGILTLGIPDTKGVTKSLVQDTLTAPYNDLESVKNLFMRYKGEIGAIIVEPIAGNMNMVLPTDDFLKGLRDLSTENECVLIFDEVMTGFRVALGGAQEIYQVQPDITCFGKIIGGGMPVGAFGGKKEIMELLAPSGPVYQAGTLSGNPVAMAAGLATLKQLTSKTYDELNQKSKQITKHIENAGKKVSIPIKTCFKGGMFGFKFIDDPNQSIFSKFHSLMLEEGVYLPPSAFEACFISTKHSLDIINNTGIAFNNALLRLDTI